MITICIPSYQRKERIKKLLAYYSELNVNFRILVGLSDEDQIYNEVVAYKNQLRIADLINIVPTPGKDVIETMSILLDIADSEYAILNCDDDFLIPEALMEMKEFLDNNSEYEAVNGKVLLFNSQNLLLYDYKMKSLINKTASERLEEFSLDYFGIIFSLFRTESYKQIMDVPEIRSIPLREEIYSSFFATLVGKIGHIRKIFLIRSYGHERRDMGSYIDDHSLNLMREFIGNKILETENLTSFDVQKNIDKALENYFSVKETKLDYSFQRLLRLVLKLFRLILGNSHFQFRHLFAFSKINSQINLAISVLNNKT